MHQSVPILMYHSVDRRCHPAYQSWTVSPERFSEHMCVLRQKGRVPLTISDLARRRLDGSLPDKAVAITFDDGLADFGDHALPLLDRFGFASTLFVTTGHVGGTARWLARLGEGERPMLSWDQVAGLPHRNVEVGAHTHSHPQLDLLSRADAKKEIELSKALLEECTGHPVRSFAYPHGYSTPGIRSLVARAGFSAACRVADGLGQQGESPYTLSRLIVTGEWTASHMEDLLDGRFAPVAPLPDQPAMQAWQFYRWARSMFSGKGQSPQVNPCQRKAQ